MRIHNVNSSGKLALVCYNHKDYDYNRRCESGEALPEERRVHRRIRRIVAGTVLLFFAVVLVWQICYGVNYYNRVVSFAEADYENLRLDLLHNSNVSSSDFDDISFVVDGSKAYVTLRGSKIELVEGELRERIFRFARDYGCQNGGCWRSDISHAVFGEVFIITFLIIAVGWFISWLLYSEGVPLETRISLRSLSRKRVFYLI